MPVFYHIVRPLPALIAFAAAFGYDFFFRSVQPGWKNGNKGNTMKKTVLFILLAAAGAGFGLGQDVVVKDQTPFVYAYIECTGSYSLISAKIGEFMNEYFSQGLGSFTGVMAMYLNAPGEVPEAELKWRIGMPIGADVTPQEPLRKDEFAYPKVASCLHVGPYDKVGEAYQKIGAYLERNGWKAAGPPVEFYLNDPGQVPPEKLETEILIPVEKK